MTMPSIRLLQGEEFLDVLYNFQMVAFRASPPFADKEGWARIVRERKGITYQALFENDKPVAAAGSTSMIQNVRDQAAKVEIWLPSYEQPEVWLADMPVKSESQNRAPMSRILNIAEIGGMEVGKGSFCVRITDPVCPFNNGLWKFESISSKLR